jgi:hypothetical protein
MTNVIDNHVSGTHGNAKISPVRNFRVRSLDYLKFAMRSAFSRITLALSAAAVPVGSPL